MLKGNWLWIVLPQYWGRERGTGMSVAKAALFDMDGVLIDSLALHREAFERYFEPKGVGIERERFDKELFGHQGPEILRLLLGDDIPLAQRQRISKEIDGIFQGLVQEKVRPVRGVRDFIRMLHRKAVPFALGTSGSRSNVEAVLAKLGLNGKFRVLITENDVLRGKPDPMVYLTAADRLGIPVSDCVVFEDTPVGISAAKNAGARCIALTTTTSRDRLTSADVVIPDFRELTWETVQDLLNHN